MKYYTGIGSRKTPSPILDLMRRISTVMETKGFILRSGAAEGADTAFFEGLKNKSNSEIFLPWERFNNFHYKPCLHNPTPKAKDIARNIIDKYHWERMPTSSRLLHSRNVHQVLGPNCDNPSEIIICWTENGDLKGGTATALKIGKSYDVRILNLGHDRIKEYFEDLTRLPWE